MLTVQPDVVERISAELRAHPDAMILELARTHGVPELGILEIIGPPRAVALDASRWEEILRALPELGNLRVLVSNNGITIETRGVFGGFSRTGDYFNVQTSSLDMHLRWPEIAGAIALEKPSHLSGRPTASIQLFDRQGAAIVKMFLLFGESDDSHAKRQSFGALREKFALSV